jgi:hypothetical protein
MQILTDVMVVPLYTMASRFPIMGAAITISITPISFICVHPVILRSPLNQNNFSGDQK